MKKFSLAFATIALAACSGDDPESGVATAGITAGIDGGGTASGGQGTVSDGNDDADGSGNGPGGPDDDGGIDPTKFDTGAGGDFFCKEKDPGWYCESNNAVECGDMGNVLSNTSCVPDICEVGVGCVECLAGQFSCLGPNVLSCNAAANPSVWQIQETCDPAAGQTCDLATGTCVASTAIGGTEPTGVYFRYALFTSGNSVYTGGYDVDSFENRLYVSSGSSIAVYEVELLDSDGDGVFEPNQHPDNLDDPGPIEERTLTYVEAIPWPNNIPASVAEIYASDEGYWVGGSAITQMLAGGGGATSVMTSPPGWASTFAQIGYDDINEVWYASNEQQRRVFQYDVSTLSWGIAFNFPPLAGDHMDGLEIVTQPETGIPYVYVSDMTSDFIGQYRLDPVMGWVQENLFEYADTDNQLVEGMGYGALNHFWATSGQGVYEVGGGDLAEFTEPPG